MLSKLTHINANTFALTDHRWLSSSSLGGTTMQFLQFIAEVNVLGMPYESVACY